MFPHPDQSISSSSSSMSPETGIDLQDRPECVCTDIPFINLINNSIVYTIVMILWFILINSLICKLIIIKLHLFTLIYVNLRLSIYYI